MTIVGEGKMAEPWRKRSQFTKQKFRPYAKAIGEFSLAWNDLHETLGDLFVEAMLRGGPPEKQYWLKLHAVWGCITNDRQKRLMLEVAINQLGRLEHQKSPRIAEEVIWLVARGHSLETKRNDVLHSPLSEMMNALAAGIARIPYGAVIPGRSPFNKRAASLTASFSQNGRELLAEIRFYRDYATVLTKYASDLARAWKGWRQTWPARPRLPRLGKNS